MEKGEFKTEPVFASTSDFLKVCYGHVQQLTGMARKKLTKCDQIGYHQLLMEKGKFITDMRDLAQEQIDQGLPIPEGVLYELEAMRADAYDVMEYAVVTQEYRPLAAMLTRKEKIHHHHGNHLELLIHNLEQQDL